MQKRQPVLRIDGAKRIDLVELRRRREAARNKEQLPVEDNRVALAWAREDARGVAAAKGRADEKLIAKLSAADGGQDNTIVASTKVRISASRSEGRSVRSRPGTFDWRYGRKAADGALYHAGCHFAILWERAGAAAAKSPDWLSAGGGDWKGLPDSRAVAIEELQGAMRQLGQVISARLSSYCVRGLTTAEIAKLHGTTERNMAPVLQEDLRACAKHFFGFYETSGNRC